MADQLMIPSQGDQTSLELKNIVDLCKQHIPRLRKANELAVASMQEFLDIPIDKYTEEDEADLKDLLINVRDTHSKMELLRKEITAPLDEFKRNVMAFEKALSDDKDSYYTRCRNILAQRQQKRIEEKKRLEAEAAKKKEKSDHLVDIGSRILQNLERLLLDQTKLAESKSKAWFDASTLENFDERADQYKKMKPALKQPDYEACFKVDYRNDLFTSAEFKDIVSSIMQAEPFDKWNEQLIENCTPIVNAWRAKIPDLKQHLINLKNANDDAERARIAEEQQRKAKEEEERRLAEAERQAVAKSMEIQSQAELNKLNNSFVQQATVQQADDTGATKLVLQFTNKTMRMKAFIQVVAHCVAHPKFPGIEKKDRSGKIVTDANSDQEYIPAVQWWIDFFMKNCDVAVDGTTVYERAKVIVRK